MSELSQDSYRAYKDAEVGDTAVLTAQDPETGEQHDYQGTIIEDIGATVRMQTTKGRMLELRSVRENDTGDMAVLLGVDGKDVSDTEKTKGVNPDGVPIYQERTKLSFDYRVKDFSSESEELYIG